MNRIVTLTTDFGLDDHYAGVMKGSILGVCPDVTLVDISHAVRPQGIMQAAIMLRSAYSHFPTRTIHVVVVDPGVGSNRRPIIISSEKYLFVGPDNGIFSFVMEELEAFVCLEITARHYFHPEVSPTFHGRDIFAPVAGWLAKGVDFSKFGSEITDPVRFKFPKAAVAEGRVEGKVMYHDRFGNLVTTVNLDDLVRTFGEKTFVCRMGDAAQPPIPFREYYSQVAKGESCVLVGSTGYLEVAVNQGRAATTLNAPVGSRVIFTPS